MKHNDIIGIGCNQLIFQHSDKSKWHEYVVYKLVDETIVENVTNQVNQPSVVIDLSSDNEEENNVNPISSNSIGYEVPKSPIAYQEEDNELVYSQQVVMEIKQEVNCSEENFGYAEDFAILIESDESLDGESLGSWANKLSQNQDLVVKKITESIQNQKRKSTVAIEAMPLAPPKRARKNATLVDVPTKSILKMTSSAGEPDPKPCDEPTKPNTMNIDNGIKIDHRNIDPRDPFVVKPKNSDKQTTFENALSGANRLPKKKRVAHVPRYHPHQSDVNKSTCSILKQANGDWPSKGKKCKIGLRVKFTRNAPQIREYTPDRDEIGIMPSCANADASIQQMIQSSFENNPLHTIISDITEWKTEWILQKDTTPPINGVDLNILPMSDKYASFDAYRK